MKKKYEKMIYGSFNMLEINYGSQVARFPDMYDIKLGNLQPWSFSYPWNSPDWREEVLQIIKQMN